MDLRRTEEQHELRDALRRLFDRRIAALVEALPTPPHHDVSTDLTDAAALGLTGLALPDETGGAGTFADLVVAHEEIGRGLGGPLFIALSDAGRLLHHATGDPRDELLGELAEGRLAMTTAVSRDGNAWRPVLAGPDARVVLVVDGTDVLVLPTDAEAVEWQQETSGSDLVRWTLRVGAATSARRLQLDDSGRRLVRREIAVLAAARQLGGGRAVLERTIDHVKAREQFGRPIGTFQAVQHQLADVATELDGVELAVAQAAWGVDTALAADERCRLADIAALTAAAAFRHATLVAHQLHGGMGFVLDSPLHLWSARAIADPTVPASRRESLDDLASASGITADGVTAPPDHRVTVH